VQALGGCGFLLRSAEAVAVIAGLGFDGRLVILIVVS
jgi:hypothetical protein